VLYRSVQTYNHLHGRRYTASHSKRKVSSPKSLLWEVKTSLYVLFFITNSSFTKFLVVTINNTLSWNHHTDLLMKKISKACYIIRNTKTYMSALSLKVIYYAFLTRLWAMELCSEETHCLAPSFLEYKKRQLELWTDVGIVSRKNLFKKLLIFPLTSQYMLHYYCL
jgi:hypothetical protein